MKIRGTIGVKGLATGPAKVWKRPKIADLSPHSVTEDVEGEIKKLEKILAQGEEELEVMIRSLEGEGRTEETQIIRFQRMLLMDSEITEAIEELISTERLPADAAFVRVMRQEVSKLLQGDTESEGEDYFAGRAPDYEDLINRVLRIFHGQDRSPPSLDTDCILISDDLNPTEVIQLLDTKRVLALALEKGSVTSHSVLIASARKIPTVLGLGKGIELIHDGDYLLVSGDRGEVILNPVAEEVAASDRGLEQAGNDHEDAERIRSLPATTVDGFKVNLEVNIGYPEEIDESTLDQIDGIGLWRTEFLFLDRKREPNEEDQVRIYGAISRKMPGKSVNIRTLDVGGDKGLLFLPLPLESNPSLGVRGIRLGLKHEGILRRQLRAILQANVNGNLRVMFPMVSRIEEVEMVRSLVDQCRQELITQGHEIKEDLPIGIMVEVPSTAMGLDLFIPLVDFLSVGTNDLIQYLLASDRKGEGVVDIYSPFYPPIIRLLRHIVHIAREGNKPLSICGEMASYPLAVPLLIGLGFERFSMSPLKLIEIKSLIRRLTRAKCQKIAEQILHMSRRVEIEEHLATFLKEREYLAGQP